jgi:hypothetical protein
MVVMRINVVKKYIFFIAVVFFMPHNGRGLAMWRHLKNVQPVTAAKFITKSSLFVLLLGVIRRLELKPISEQKVENIFVAPPYWQTECCTP